MKNLLILLTFIFSFHVKSQFYFPPLTGTTWETIDPLSLGYCQENIAILQSYLDQTNSKAFILLKDGKIVFEWYYDTFTKDSLYVWNSAGKTLTAMAVGIAEQEGLLQLSDTTSTYLGQGWTSLSPEQEEKIIILHQLTMTTGLKYKAGTDHYCTLPSCLEYIAEPGTRWSYHNAPYTLLDGVIEAATGMNLNLYVQQKIRSKIGMNGLFFQVGYNNVHVSNARSMARYGLLLLAQGNWNGTAVLDNPDFFQAMTNSSQNLNPSYGYLTWLNGKSSYMLPSPDVQISINQSAVPNGPNDMYAALGKNGQIINVVPSQNLVFIRMGESDGTSLVGNQYNDTIWQKINQLSCSNSLTNDYLLETNNIYPNPSSSLLHLDFSENITDYVVTDIQGKKYNLIKENNTINIESLSKGIYFLKVEIGEKHKIMKFIKI
jgi:CubicO group peptidase (beta-lactamase class C family)